MQCRAHRASGGRNHGVAVAGRHSRSRQPPSTRAAPALSTSSNDGISDPELMLRSTSSCRTRPDDITDESRAKGQKITRQKIPAATALRPGVACVYPESVLGT